MTIVLVTVMMYGVAVGFVQGYYNAESHGQMWSIMDNLTKEVEKSNWVGCIVGGASAVALAWVRQQEVESKGPRQKDEHDVEQALARAPASEYQTLNADSDSDEDMVLLNNDNPAPESNNYQELAQSKKNTYK